jgi:hypothetical protein
MKFCASQLPLQPGLDPVIDVRDEIALIDNRFVASRSQVDLSSILTRNQHLLSFLNRQ